jgi:thioredoxin reductase (NADPH)
VQHHGVTSAEYFDLLIIGAGPAGLATAIEARNGGLNYCILEKGSIANGIRLYQRDMFFFSTPEMLEIGGLPFIVPTTRPTSLDCVNYYRKAAEHFGLNCRFYSEVSSVRRNEHGFDVETLDGGRYSAAAVVLAMGYYFTPNLLGVPGEGLPHVTHYYTDPLPYFRQKVLIVGGKNSAVEAALDLWRHGAHVTLVHRGPAPSQGVKYWILPDFENRVAAGAIKVFYDSHVVEFRQGCTIVQRKDNSREEVSTDFAFILTGYTIDTAFCRSAGLDLNPETSEPVHNPATMESSVPGLYVAGGMVGGRMNNKVFIENGRRHGALIVAHLLAGGSGRA